MGNCATYCGGCKEDGTRFDHNQVRNSYKDRDYAGADGLGGDRMDN